MKIDLRDIFNFRIALILGFVGSVFILISWGFEISRNGQFYFQFLDAPNNFQSLDEIPSSIIKYTYSWFRISLSAPISFLMIIISFILLLKDRIIILDKEISHFQVAIILIIVNIINFFGTSGFIIGSILGICSGTFIVIGKYIGSEEYERPKKNSGGQVIDVDIS
ncbi:MAG: hypothetical protein GF329_05050 [Candidatus Lokiarchaeota archaeon]|nr:hypothetical protein [Candidatus Lokiarchaeota archaeon]